MGNRGIGYRGQLPWNIPEEYQIFLDHAKGSTLIMGRISYEVFKGDLSESNVMVLSRGSFMSQDVQVFDSMEKAMQEAQKLEHPIYVSGGAQIYELGLPIATRMYLSFIKDDYPSDTFFPNFDQAAWHRDLILDHPQFIHYRYSRARS